MEGPLTADAVARDVAHLRGEVRKEARCLDNLRDSVLLIAAELRSHLHMQAVELSQLRVAQQEFKQELREMRSLLAARGYSHAPVQ